MKMFCGHTVTIQAPGAQVWEYGMDLARRHS